jgi:hypothetical protein
VKDLALKEVLLSKAALKGRDFSRRGIPFSCNFSACGTSHLSLQETLPDT